jgi:hypothetical protein
MHRWIGVTADGVVNISRAMEVKVSTPAVHPGGFSSL